MASKIHKLSITGLFKDFDYEIPFPSDERLRILTGPNGYGKTTILNIIKAIGKGDLIYFYTLPFNSISLSFSNGMTLRIDSKLKPFNDNDSERDDTELMRQVDFTITSPDGNRSTLVINSAILRNSAKRQRYYAHVYDIDFDDVNSAKFLQYVRKNSEEIFHAIAASQDNSTFLLDLEALMSVTMIQAQRLFFRNDENHLSSRIQDISKKLSEILKKEYFTFLSNSQSKDSSFIDHFLNQSYLPISAEEYAEKVARLNQAFENLRKFDLITSIRIPEFQENKSEALRCYLNDLEEKISVYDDILNRLNLFIDILNEKKFRNKKFIIDRRNGLRMQSLSDREFIPLDALSSGEKNEIIMLYDFIFNVENGATLLIDEPEISLHVAWQVSFMDDILKVADLRDFSVVVATHSPEIINEQWDKTVDLYALVENELDN